MGKFIGKLKAVTEILVVTDIVGALYWTPGRSHLPNSVENQVYREYSSGQRERGIEFFDEYPEQLVQQFEDGGSDYEIPDLHDYHRHSQEWVEKRGRSVWGWRRIKYNKPVIS